MARILRITPEMAGVPAAAPLARQGDTPSPWPAIAKAATGLASTVETTGNQLIRIQNALQDEDAKLDMLENFNKFRADYKLRGAEIRAGLAQPGTETASDMDGGVGIPDLGGGPELRAGPAEEDPDFVLAGPSAPPGLPSAGGAATPTGPAGVLANLPALIQPAAQPTARPLQQKDYADTYNKELDRMVEESVKRLKYPGREREYRAKLAPFIGAAKLEALNQGIKLQHEAIIYRDDRDARLEANVAVFGRTPEIRAAAEQSRLSRIDAYVAKGILSGTQGAAARQEFRHNVDRGTAVRDYADPTKRAGVMDSLLNGSWSLAMRPEEQLELAETLQNRIDTRAEKAEKKREEAAKKEYTATVDDLYARASPLAGADRMTPEQFTTEITRRGLRLHRTDFEAIQNQLTKEADEAPSDPTVRARVMADVLSMNPRYSEADLRQLNEAHRGSVRTLSGKDYQTALTHRTSRISAIEGKTESRTTRDYHQADTLLRSGLGIPDIIPDKFDPIRLQALEWARQELNTRSWPTNGRTPSENALTAVKDILPRAKALLGDNATMNMDQIRSLLESTAPELAKAPNAADMMLRLEAGRKSGRYNDVQYENTRRLVLEFKRAWVIHFQNAAGATTPSAPAGPKPAAPSGGGGGRGPVDPRYPVRPQ